MKKFYNRQNELVLLNKHFTLSKNSLFVEVIMGRRRIGKTELIKKYIDKKQALYFYATKKSSQIILNDFTNVLKEYFSFIPSEINNWEDFLNLIFELSKNQRLIVIFDEFQNFNSIDKSIFSILQKEIDEHKNSSKMHLIFIGSVQTLMEKIFMKKEPLYGRIDNFIYLKPFNFSEVALICKDHKVKNLENILNLFSIFGGVAKYYDFLEKFNLFNKQLETILKELFISRNTPLYKEGESLLIEEFGQDYERYFDILFCLSIGKTKTSEIASLMRLPVTTVSKYISILIKEYKLVEKRNLRHKKNSKDNRYYVKDIFLRFWFHYVYKNYTKIEIGSYQPILADFKKTFPYHKGFIFEELARELLYKKILEEKILPCQPQMISNYWDKKYEFDIYGKCDKSFLIGEIKLNSKAINKKLINKIEEFVGFRGKKAIKVIIAFDKITNIKIKELLKQKDFYVFSFNNLIRRYC